MLNEFSKTDKKAARRAIDIALQRDFNRILNEYYELLSKWKVEKSEDNRQAYGTLYKAVRDNDKYIARRYDSLSGSQYFNTVVSLLIDEVLFETDLTDFSDEAKQHLLAVARTFKGL